MIIQPKRFSRHHESIFGPIKETGWEMTFLDYHIRYGHTPSSSPMGRFGGGFQWEVGFQLGGRTLIINLLVASIRITRPKR